MFRPPVLGGGRGASPISRLLRDYDIRAPILSAFLGCRIGDGVGHSIVFCCFSFQIISAGHGVS
jgi:hypothetical protein